ncbi:transposase domain protein [Orientia tsutsugamushi str. TA716]|uniref:Transposase domain protein n=1 Tax=Orientia tsutsugamushi str. TA716 TaxID=1359175 RepID=A0A0F3NQH8_ORITS|nr:transposase domain protein [Orientia tsutsugamushi str. TA716]KJV77290.1 transposase domain protein [Orientia tsutsugamushi str. TA716]
MLYTFRKACLRHSDILFSRFSLQQFFFNNRPLSKLVNVFKIIADKYRNRRKRFGLRFNLTSGIYNFELR